MKRKTSRDEMIAELKKLAFGNCSDAVKLLYMEPEDLSGLDRLDLRHVSELKRNANGTVEIKLASRFELLQLLAEMMEDSESAAESFISAISSAAGNMGRAKDEI